MAIFGVNYNVGAVYPLTTELAVRLIEQEEREKAEQEKREKAEQEEREKTAEICQPSNL